jgi:putative transposase
MRFIITPSTIYDRVKGKSKSNIEMMKLMDKHILQEQTAGVMTIRSILEENGITTGYERIRRLMWLTNITPNLSKKAFNPMESKYIYLYILRNLAIMEVNQIYEIDMTYVRMQKEFMYLTTLIDD